MSKNISGIVLRQEIHNVNVGIVGKSIPTYFKGDDAYTDFKSITIPYISPTQNYDWEQAMVLRGYSNHEAGHILYTDPYAVANELERHISKEWGDAFRRARDGKETEDDIKLLTGKKVKKGKKSEEDYLFFIIAKKIDNCCEDWRLERNIAAHYPGAHRNINTTRTYINKREHKYNTDLVQSGAYVKPGTKIGQLITYLGCIQNNYACAPYAHTNYEIIKSIAPEDAALIEKFWPEIVRCETSAELTATAFSLSKEILRLFREEKQQQKEDQSEKGDQDQEDNSDQKDNQKESQNEPNAQTSDQPDDKNKSDKKTDQKGSGTGSGKSDEDTDPEENEEGEDQTGKGNGGDDQKEDSQKSKPSPNNNESEKDSKKSKNESKDDDNLKSNQNDQKAQNEPNTQTSDQPEDKNSSNKKKDKKESGDESGENEKSEDSDANNNQNKSPKGKDEEDQEGNQDSKKSNTPDQKNKDKSDQESDQESDPESDKNSNQKSDEKPKQEDKKGKPDPIEIGDFEGDQNSLDISDIIEKINETTEKSADKIDKKTGVGVAGQTAEKEVEKIKLNYHTSTAKHQFVENITNSGINISRLSQAMRKILMGHIKKLTYRNREDGILDMKNVVGIIGKSNTVYKQTKKTPRKRSAIYFCLDHSASMLLDPEKSQGLFIAAAPAGKRIVDYLSKATSALMQAIGTSPDVNIAIANFTSNDQAKTKITMIKGFDESPSAAKAASGAILLDEHYGGTPTAYALMEAYKAVYNRTEENKIIILITDGHPDNKKLANEAAQTIKSHGVKLIGIGIGKNASSGGMHFDGWTTIKNLSELTENLSSVVRKLI